MKRGELSRMEDGWLVDDEDGWRFFRSASPPRPGSYRRQLAIDVKSWKPWASWLLALGPLAAGAFTGIWGLCGFGAITAAAYGVMLHTVVRNWRDTVLVPGRVTELKPHPLMQRFRTGAALVPMRDLTIPVQVALEAGPAEELLERHRALDVLILLNPVEKQAQGTFAPVLAFRPSTSILEPSTLPAPKEERQRRTRWAPRVILAMSAGLAILLMSEARDLRGHSRPRRLSPRSSLCHTDGDCRDGLSCVGSGHDGTGPLGSDGICNRVCERDADCPPRERCVPPSITQLNSGVCIGSRAPEAK